MSLTSKIVSKYGVKELQRYHKPKLGPLLNKPPLDRLKINNFLRGLIGPKKVFLGTRNIYKKLRAEPAVKVSENYHTLSTQRFLRVS